MDNWITTALTNLWTVVNGVITEITGNTFLAILLVSSLVIVACKVFKKIKKAASK